MAQISNSALAYSMAYETNPLSSEMIEFREELWESGGPSVCLDDKRLDKVVRLRLLIPTREEQRGGLIYADVSYCYGVLKDGTKVRVTMTHRIDLRKGVKAGIVQMCKQSGVYGKKLGLLDDNVISTLR